MSLISQLHTEKFENNSGHDASATPMAAGIVTVTLDQIDTYNGNPRQSVNPEFDNIKESIRAIGLKQPMSITRRPGAEHYMIRDGGNTRLKILHELWNETGDDRYFRLELPFTPWEQLAHENKHHDPEVSVLVGHIIENEARGSMLFIERALAAQRLKSFVEDESSMSLRKVCTEFSELGWRLDASNLSVLLYGAEILYPHLEQSFWGGMGRPRVKELRSLQANYEKFLKVNGHDTHCFYALWSGALSSIDDPDGISIDELRQRVETDLESEIAVKATAINLEINLIQDGSHHSQGQADQSGGYHNAGDNKQQTSTRHTQVPAENEGGAEYQVNTGNTDSSGHGSELPEVAARVVLGQQASLDKAQGVLASTVPSAGPVPGDLSDRQLLGSCYQAAYSVAVLVGLERYITALPDDNLGFDFPGNGFFVNPDAMYEIGKTLQPHAAPLFAQLVFLSGFGFTSDGDARGPYWGNICKDPDIAISLLGLVVYGRAGITDHDPGFPCHMPDTRREMDNLEGAIRAWREYATSNHTSCFPAAPHDNLFYPTTG